MSLPTNVRDASMLHQIAAKISSALIRSTSESLDDALVYALGKICDQSDAACGSLFYLQEDRKTLSKTCDWCRDSKAGSRDFLSAFPLESFAPHLSDLEAGHSLSVGYLAHAPPRIVGKATREKTADSRPFAFFPLHIEGRLEAVIALYGDVGVEKDWSPNIAAIITATADALINAILRIRSEAALRLSAEKLRESERRYKLVSELTSDYWFRLEVAPDGRATMKHITDNYYAVTGRTKEDVMTVDMWSRVIVPEDLGKVLALLKELMTSPMHARIECRAIIHKSREERCRWIEITTKSEWDESEQRVSGIVGAVKDITVRKQAEEAMVRLNQDLIQAKESAEERERLHRVMYNSTPVLMHSVDMNGNLISVNDHWLETMGYKAEEVLGTPSIRYLTEESAEKARRFIPEILEKGIVTNAEAQAVTRSGEIIDILVGVKVVHDANGNPTQMVTTLLDISDRKHAEEAIRMRESYLTAIIENQPRLMWLKDASGRFLAVNRAFAQSCGKAEREELIGKTDFDIWPEELAAKYRTDDEATMKNGKSVGVEETIFDKGEYRWFETFKTPVKDNAGKIIGSTGYARDITVRKREEEALRNVQKLESLGVLAGGIAHDFNNLLGGIFGYIDLAAEKSTERMVQDMLARALATIDRAKGLTQQLLTFSKGGAPVKKAESLISFIPETARFALSGSPVSCAFDFPDDLWLCEFDKNQIGQVIDNIVINAQQAMPEGGTIEIVAANTYIDESDYSVLKPGHYVKVSVRDHGIGMPKGIVPRIFDPFFTTKTKGHGLGLATSYSIVHRHGGVIEVESEQGKGSTFHFYLPADPTAVRAHKKRPDDEYRSFGTVIVMDDEEVIRETVGSMLKSLGYTVISTQNGNEAIDVLKRHNDTDTKVEAIILDLTVPGGMGGREAVKEIRKIDRRLPVFVASGYADDPVMADPKNHGFTDSICKPFRRVDLAEMLRRNIID